MDKFIVTSKDLSGVFGISVRQVQRLTLDGTIEPETLQRPYQYDLTTACRQYCEYITQKLQTQSANERIAELESEKLKADVEMRAAKAAIAKLEQAELEGKMHRAEDVEAILTSHVLFARSLLMALPGKLAVDLAGDHTAAEVAEKIKKEVYFILNSLADFRYNPEEYAERVRERRGLSGVISTVDTSVEVE